VSLVLGLTLGRALAGEATPDLPPSPSSVPGIRIWPDPAFTHWPAIAYADETRNVAFSLPVKVGGVNGTIAWSGKVVLPFTLPTDTDSISGLVPMPTELGRHDAVVAIDGKQTPLAFLVADAHEAWPLAALKNGFPVDANGTPVVLMDRRRNLKDERTWSLVEGNPTRPSGRALVVGDPLEALGGDAWTGLDADLRPALDERYPQHAVLVALAKLPDPLPRTVLWCPGNQVLFGGAWSPEEERVLGAIRSRFERLKVMPRLILALPPLPIDEALREQAQERRELLLRTANVLSWTVIDLARAAGDPERANQVAPGVFTRYPKGEAQERLRQSLREALDR
jgi:hypothetical protein